jgi:hypothetical protein
MTLEFPVIPTVYQGFNRIAKKAVVNCKTEGGNPLFTLEARVPQGPNELEVVSLLADIPLTTGVNVLSIEATENRAISLKASISNYEYVKELKGVDIICENNKYIHAPRLWKDELLWDDGQIWSE